MPPAAGSSLGASFHRVIHFGLNFEKLEAALDAQSCADVDLR